MITFQTGFLYWDEYDVQSSHLSFMQSSNRSFEKMRTPSEKGIEITFVKKRIIPKSHNTHLAIFEGMGQR